MTAENFDNALAILKNRRPFRPFTVSLTDGTQFEVDHPDALAYRDGWGMFAGPVGVPHLFDHEGVTQIIGDLMNQDK